MHVAHVTQADEHPRLYDDGTSHAALQTECAVNGRLIIAAVNRFDALVDQRNALALALERLTTMMCQHLGGDGDVAAVHAALVLADATLLAVCEHPAEVP
jgi:hypothetical protein